MAPKKILIISFSPSVGNKIDESAELREVSHAEGQAQAAEWCVQFMETSAKTNHNVTELFQVCRKKFSKGLF